MFIKNKIMKQKQVKNQKQVNQKQVNQPMPTANIAINKSRMKVYNKKSDMPTYYLQKGQEFQIELFNPTSDIILAKISLNSKAIAQGGLVLKPGQRVFLDRYIDVAKKFKFDTYEVANTQEVKEAIKDNGDFKVEFFKQEDILPYLNLPQPSWTRRTYISDPHYPHFNQPYCGSNIPCGASGGNGGNTTTTSFNASSGEATLDSLDLSDIQTTNINSNSLSTSSPRKRRRVLKAKSIETGRVEMGSNSSQELKTVSYDFESFSFHTIIYKMLPISQKVNTVQDVNVKRHCTECGTKAGRTHKFCNQCGNKV